MLLPDDGLGVIALANADDKHTQELVVSYRVIEDFLRLSHLASMQDMSLSAAAESSFTGSGAGSLPLSTYKGTYSSPGYPTLTLCDSHTDNDVSQCTDVLRAYSALENLDSHNTTLYFAWPSVWTSHGRLQRREGDQFQFTATYLFPEGYGKNKTGFETAVNSETRATVRFAISHGISTGFGIFGLVGELTEQDRLGVTLEERAEIWFDRVRP
jgi:hypothetical protein